MTTTDVLNQAVLAYRHGDTTMVSLCREVLAEAGQPATTAELAELAATSGQCAYCRAAATADGLCSDPGCAAQDAAERAYEAQDAAL